MFPPYMDWGMGGRCAVALLSYHSSSSTGCMSTFNVHINVCTCVYLYVAVGLPKHSRNGSV